MDDFQSETDSDYTSYWRDWVCELHFLWSESTQESGCDCHSPRRRRHHYHVSAPATSTSTSALVSPLTHPSTIHQSQCPLATLHQLHPLTTRSFVNSQHHGWQYFILSSRPVRRRVTRPIRRRLRTGHGSSSRSKRIRVVFRRALPSSTRPSLINPIPPSNLRISRIHPYQMGEIRDLHPPLPFPFLTHWANALTLLCYSSYPPAATNTSAKSTKSTSPTAST